MQYIHKAVISCLVTVSWIVVARLTGPKMIRKTAGLTAMCVFFWTCFAAHRIWYPCKKQTLLEKYDYEHTLNI